MTAVLCVWVMTMEYERKVIRGDQGVVNDGQGRERKRERKGKKEADLFPLDNGGGHLGSHWSMHASSAGMLSEGNQEEQDDRFH